MKAEQPLLTPSQVRQWQDRIAEIDAAMTDMQQERARLARRVEAAMVFMEDMPESPIEPIVEPPLPEPDGQDAGDLVVAAVKAIGGQARPATIKERLAQAAADSYAHKLAQGPYFYTVLMRLARAERLVKEGGQYRLPQSSAQAETTAGDRGSL